MRQSVIHKKEVNFRGLICTRHPEVLFCKNKRHCRVYLLESCVYKLKELYCVCVCVFRYMESQSAVRPCAEWSLVFPGVRLLRSGRHPPSS